MNIQRLMQLLLLIIVCPFLAFHAALLRGLWFLESDKIKQNYWFCLLDFMPLMQLDPRDEKGGMVLVRVKDKPLRGAFGILDPASAPCPMSSAGEGGGCSAGGSSIGCFLSVATANGIAQARPKVALTPLPEIGNFNCRQGEK